MHAQFRHTACLYRTITITGLARINCLFLQFDSTAKVTKWHQKQRSEMKTQDAKAALSSRASICSTISEDYTNYERTTRISKRRFVLQNPTQSMHRCGKNSEWMFSINVSLWSGTVEPLTNDHPRQRPSLWYDHISSDGQWFMFVYESLTSDHPSYTTTPMWLWGWSYKRGTTVIRYLPLCLDALLRLNCSTESCNDD